MRLLCTPLSLCLAAAAALLPAAVPAHAAPGPVRKADPTCAAQDDRHFPLTTRIHGGPDTYEAGGGYGTWYLDLTNTTARTCANIHPVVVLVDAGHVLKPSQPHLEFYDGTRPHPVRFETTDEDELVGAFDDGFPGFTVGPGKTVTVKVRLTLTSDAVTNVVTADAAVVQRRGDDGDWVGQSNDYAFRIHNDLTPTPTGTTPTGATPTGTGTTPPSRTPRLPFADELARTGLVTPGGALAATAVLLVTGGAVLLARRRR
ncbi:hypothetical protein GCM10022403_069340 [Streptomyces coacervatus]|uniref:Gram-positive cocci surface proteins LPxTG domain-containing protein n=1 Tax=Streptomyces coacervatus TaxID=647381 RepID=A0ABP7ISX4_9ACTN|nr:hypothetical protein [Streptomyces coacervatus]MDF2266646.1 hypothetical protein [Streptomyces coacervatus]